MNQPTRRSLAPWVFVAVVVAGMMVAMRMEGRLWISKSGLVRLWHTNVWSSECSQQFTDPYSITHMSHGLFFAVVFGWAGGMLARRGFGAMWGWAGDWRWQLAAGLFIAAGWEVLENSPMVIERYRSVTMSYDYLGDSIFNSVGDLASCAVGFFVARWLGVWKTLVFFVATELILLWLIRDNLTLNVIMLISPIEAVKQWQGQGAPGPV